MARNEEKAMAMLNRWVRMKRSLNTKQRDKRPENPLECESIQECEIWRNSIIRELVKRVSDIQNASLGEHRIRDLNDDINNLIVDKGKWEDRIRELGGPDYRLMSSKIYETGDGVEVPGAAGYKYFGAAKNLPKLKQGSKPKTQDEGLQSDPKRRKLDNQGQIMSAQDQLKQQDDVMDIEAFKSLYNLKFNAQHPQNKALKVIDDENEIDNNNLDQEEEKQEQIPSGNDEQQLNANQQQQPAKTKEDLLKKLAEKKKQLLMKKYGSIEANINADVSQSLETKILNDNSNNEIE